MACGGCGVATFVSYDKNSGKLPFLKIGIEKTRATKSSFPH